MQARRQAPQAVVAMHNVIMPTQRLQKDQQRRPEVAERSWSRARAQNINCMSRASQRLRSARSRINASDHQNAICLQLTIHAHTPFPQNHSNTFHKENTLPIVSFDLAISLHRQNDTPLCKEKALLGEKIFSQHTPDAHTIHTRTSAHPSYMLKCVKTMETLIENWYRYTWKITNFYTCISIFTYLMVQALLLDLQLIFRSTPVIMLRPGGAWLVVSGPLTLM